MNMIGKLKYRTMLKSMRGKIYFKKISRKDKYWHIQLTKAFWYIRWPQIMQYCDSLTLRCINLKKDKFIKYFSSSSTFTILNVFFMRSRTHCFSNSNFLEIDKALELDNRLLRHINIYQSYLEPTVYISVSTSRV